MSKQSPSPVAGRRAFLKGASLIGAAAVTPRLASAQPATPSNDDKAVARPNIALETMPPAEDPVTQTSSGGDFMVDVLKTLDIDYVAMNCASSFRGIHEAIINHGKNIKPEILTCTHEEIAVHIAQGYAKMEGKPMAVMCHGTVGLQHASMALYNAWCDRVPVYLMIGNYVDADKREGAAEWLHAALDPAAGVRDFMKWDDQPASLQHFAESAVRAYKIATTPPMGPVLLALDAELQENPILDSDRLRIPKAVKVAMPQGDPGAVAEAAKLLVSAESPVIICDYLARTHAGMALLVELAEMLQCPVIDIGGRANFPTLHPLNHTFRRGPVMAQADLVVGLELNDFHGAVNGFSSRIVHRTTPLLKPGTKTISLGIRDLYGKSNYQDFQRYADVDVAIAGDGEATLPALIENVKRLIDSGLLAAYDKRGKKLAATRLAMIEQAKSDATIGWDASPITTARMCAELYAQIKNEDWSLVGNGIGMTWPRRLWDFDKPHRWNGGSGGAGQGYNGPASLGAALANQRHGRLSVSIQGDGDFMYAPGTLWTAAHHRIPILYVMHNNRAYHQEYMYLQVMSNRRERGVENAHIGTTITDPDIDYATLAKSFGVYGEGPITDPKDLGPALARAIAVVKNGRPALVDVVMESR